jgi:hypothetical protein
MFARARWRICNTPQSRRKIIHHGLVLCNYIVVQHRRKL